GGEAGPPVAPGHAVSSAPPGRGDTSEGKGRGISDGEAEGEGEGEDEREAEGKAASEGGEARAPAHHPVEPPQATRIAPGAHPQGARAGLGNRQDGGTGRQGTNRAPGRQGPPRIRRRPDAPRSEEHTSELQSRF